MIPSEYQRSRFLDPKENSVETRLSIYHDLIESAATIKKHSERYPIQIEFKSWYICIVEPDQLDKVLTWMRPIIAKEQGIIPTGPYR